MTRAKRTDPISSHKAAQKATQSASEHRAMIRKALDRKPRQTAQELVKHLKGKLSYHQVMRRLSECAQKGERRECSTGKPSTEVYEWF